MKRVAPFYTFAVSFMSRLTEDRQISPAFNLLLHVALVDIYGENLALHRNVKKSIFLKKSILIAFSDIMAIKLIPPKY